jgi:hypothetical protein
MNLNFRASAEEAVGSAYFKVKPQTNLEETFVSIILTTITAQYKKVRSVPPYDFFTFSAFSFQAPSALGLNVLKTK